MKLGVPKEPKGETRVGIVPSSMKKLAKAGFEVLIEKESKKSKSQWAGKTTHMLTTVFPKGDYKVGDMVMVRVDDCTGATLIGEAIGYSDMEGPLRMDQ